MVNAAIYFAATATPNTAVLLRPWALIYLSNLIVMYLFHNYIIMIGDAVDDHILNTGVLDRTVITGTVFCPFTFVFSLRCVPIVIEHPT